MISLIMYFFKGISCAEVSGTDSETVTDSIVAVIISCRFKVNIYLLFVVVIIDKNCLNETKIVIIYHWKITYYFLVFSVYVNF